MSHAKRLMVAVNEGILDCMDVLEALINDYLPEGIVRGFCRVKYPEIIPDEDD